MRTIFASVVLAALLLVGATPLGTHAQTTAAKKTTTTASTKKQATKKPAKKPVATTKKTTAQKPAQKKEVAVAAAGAETKLSTSCNQAIMKANAYCKSVAKGCTSFDTSAKCVAANKKCEAEQEAALALCPANL